MAVKTSPKTPASARGSKKVEPDSTPRPTRRSGRTSTSKLDPDPKSEPDSPQTPSASPENLRGSVSPYFAKNGSQAGNGRGPAKKARTSTSRTAKAKVTPKARNRRTTKGGKDPRDVTGLTDTEDSQSDSDGGGDTEDEFAPSDDEGVDEEVEDEEEEEEEDDSYDSDEIDTAPKRGTKRKGGPSAKASAMKSNGSAKKGKNGHSAIEGYEDEDDLSEVELEEGQEIAGRIYPAPKTGQVPPGRISLNTLNFLKNLQIPERNDREWFRSHEPAYRQAEKEWKMFVGLVQLKMQEADNQLPHLPPKDVIHRIYRDVRFSSDKTPYKRSFSLSTSRGGRKGVWAGYHLSVCPNDKSIIACGVWCPGKDELATIRHHILNEPERLRQVIGEERFVNLFGPAKPHAKGERQNVFGHEDALKVAPKGVDKGHKDIDLLKLRSVAVVHHFTDQEVLDEKFHDNVKGVMQVMAPLVHLLNDFISLPP